MNRQTRDRRTETLSNALRAQTEVYLPADVLALEKAAESLVRSGDIPNAVALWALALRVRQAVKT
jgi:hypothetical protein